MNQSVIFTYAALGKLLPCSLRHHTHNPVAVESPICEASATVLEGRPNNSSGIHVSLAR